MRLMMIFFINFWGIHHPPFAYFVVVVMLSFVDSGKTTALYNMHSIVSEPCSTTCCDKNKDNDKTITTKDVMSVALDIVISMVFYKAHGN